MTELKSGFGGGRRSADGVRIRPSRARPHWVLHICVRCGGLRKETEKGEKETKQKKRRNSKEVTAKHLLLTMERNFSGLVTTSNNRT